MRTTTRALSAALAASALLLAACGRGGPGGGDAKISGDKIVLAVLNDSPGCTPTCPARTVSRQ